MASYANTLSKVGESDPYIKKFRSLFEMHHVGFGTPEDFSGFMQKLAQNRHFAMDFWALTGSLSKREGGELSVEQMLDVIGEAVIGGEIPVHDDGIRTLAEELSALLSGVDLYSPSRISDEEEAVAPPPPVSSLSHAVAQAKAANDDAKPASEEGPKKPVGAATSSAEAAENVTSQSASSIADVQSQLDEALMRLELKELELKEHLEHLDKKMSRLEPRVEELTSKVYSEPVRPAARKPAENSRLVLEPKEETLADTHNDAFGSTPLAGYSHRSGGNVAVIIVILAAVILGAVVVQQTYGSSVWLKAGTVLRERFDALREKMSGTKPGRDATTTTTSNPGTVSEQIPADPQTSAVSPSSPPPQVSDQPPAQASPSAVVSSHDADAKPRLSRKLAHTAENDSTDRGTQNVAEEANAVRVAPAVMEANLLASRVPAYPETAKEDRIEGPVVVQAIISKDGFVDRVHVIEGNPRLRSAATEAISKWRYKPYLLNGHPVEVATTITVDFSLDEW